MMRKIKQLLSTITIRNKLMAILALFFLIIAVIGSNFIIQTGDIYNKSFLRINDTNLKQLKSNVVNKMAEWGNAIDALVDNKAFYTYLNYDFTSDYEAYLKYVNDIQPFVYSIVKGVSINDIRVFSNNSTIRISGVTNNRITELENLLWYDEKEDRASGYNWVFTTVKKGYFVENFICCYKVRFSGNEKNPDNKLVYSIFISPGKIDDLLSEETKSGNRFILLDDRNIVVSSSWSDLLGKQAEDVVCVDATSGKSLLDVPGDTSVNCADGEFMLKTTDITSENYGIEGWRLIYLAQVNQLRNETRLIALSSATICIVSFLSSLALVLLISNNIVRRISGLIHELKKVRAGDFHVEISINGHDEISVLEDDFNDTISRLNALIQEVFEVKNKIMQAELSNQILQNMNREAQIISLQYQMNPHYLFNTFETIRMELIHNKHKELAGIVRAFAENVRLSLYVGEGMYTLNDELQLLNNFMIVQQYRYNKRIQFIQEVDDAALCCRIPKLCIQPLLENAIIHGAEALARICLVRLEVSRQADTLRIHIHDNGQGISSARLDELRQIIYADQETAERLLRGNCSALRNVHWRIILIYGDTYGIQIDSREGEYTDVVLTMKYTVEKEQKTGGDQGCTGA